MHRTSANLGTGTLHWLKRKSRGLIAAALVLLNTVLGWFRPDLGESLGMVTGLPMLLNEIFLGIWLIIRGFNPPATAIEPARQLVLET